jgi:heat shock protein HslJ/uncharacterized lipoprotein YbaY
MIRFFVPWLAALALFLGAAPVQAGKLSGTALIRERIALPPDAVFEARIVDASAPGGPELPFAAMRKAPAGFPPWRFEIDYDSSQVQPGQRYLVRATLSVRGQVLFSAEPPVPVGLDGADPPLQMVLVSAGAVAMPGGPGVPAGPGLVVPPASPSTRLTGMFTYMADAARIRLCNDGRSLPVAMEGDYRALESAYSQARAKPGQAVLVVVQGHVAQRPSAEWGRPPEATLVVDRFEQIRPRETCGQPLQDSALRGTLWQLVQLEGQRVTVASGQRAPQLTISADGTQVSGHGGCNRMSGPVEIRSDRISFSRLASTRMACATGQQLESAFFDALERSARWKISGSQLELRDSRGRVLARLEAAPVR